MSDWILFKDQFPEKYREIIIKHPDDNEEYETRTYIHQGNIMIEFRDGNTFFAGLSPKLFPEGSKWRYKEDIEKELNESFIRGGSKVWGVYKFPNGNVAVFGYDEQQVLMLQGVYSEELENKIRQYSDEKTIWKGFTTNQN